MLTKVSQDKKRADTEQGGKKGCINKAIYYVSIYCTCKLPNQHKGGKYNIYFGTLTFMEN